MTRGPQTSLNLDELLGYVGMVIERGIPGSVWVRAEIASVTDRRHLYLDLVQHDAGGREVAKCRANLWARERFAIEGKFRRAVGGGIVAGIAVLLSVVPEFHPQFGFSLTVLDVAPEFTIGDMARKLDAIRDTLTREGLYERNKAFEVPRDFTRVAVMSPRNAAGLGDFRREADRLAAARACDFVYFEATFQGREAPKSLLRALADVTLEHAREPFDALVVVRGGGATTDLAWLNDLDLARAACTLPMPLVTGIGHARDDTILDEVALVRRDTPSKAAAFILRKIAEAAGEAAANFAAIASVGREVLGRAERETDEIHGRVRRAARRLVDREEASVDAFMRQALGLSPQRTLRRGYALVRRGAHVVTTAEDARSGGALFVQFRDGDVPVTLDSRGS
ncbi:exodeoxyribonuclease VII large subunit [Deinococcus yavapaiensis]|uniref:Exodeoxyribonuclease 7 large subunit n=1 Tax=Deinococcus yavapaiensis KR-236 TaxID=694435 RepID=A0A318S895_9DEIO|nr:exodeoxyribonuclease VII large subunit [Deinococcus yavapaiensis]PYE55276.1 exodeoxyribonuclease VII large subunit [Deinococcus yavapaiensis KR-236]